jgi:hypothetical protein
MSHQPDQAAFRSILPDWQRSQRFRLVRLTLVGHPSEPGLNVIDQGRGAGGVKLMPHKQTEDRISTVMSGVFTGLREEFDGDKAKAYPPESVIVLPGNAPHHHWP